MTSSLHRLVRRTVFALACVALALGSAQAQERAQAPDGQGGVTLIAAGGNTTCALQPDGRAACWGDNVWGQASPPQGEHFVQLKNGGLMACGLRADGRAVCWGYSNYTAVPSGEVFRSLAVGYNFACGLRTDGQAVCWGDNGQGQASPPAGQAFVAIEAGYGFACGLRADGTAACWGANDAGQATPPAGATFAALALGSLHACGLRADGAVQCWGVNNYGQLTPPGSGYASITAGMDHTCGLLPSGVAQCWGFSYGGETAVPPGETFIAVSAGRNHVCGVRPSGTPRCWGNDGNGQLGVATGLTLASLDVGTNIVCARQSDGTPTCWGGGYSGPIPPPSGEKFAVVSTGNGHACGLRNDATMRCWGRNDYGQATAPAGTFSQVSAGGTHTCALRSDSTLACWGNTAGGRTTPPTGQFWNLSTGENHACAVRPNGSVACWGDNSHGAATAPAGTFSQVAAGDWFTCGLSAGAVRCWGDFYGAIPAGSDYIQLQAGRAHVCGRRNDGTLGCGGIDQFGQSTAPAGTFTSVSAGDDTSCGIRTNGGPTVCWGRNLLPDGAYGPFGLGSVAAGWQHSCTRTAAGVPRCWGDNTEGQTSATTGTAAELEVGERNTCALGAAGAVQCWGRNVEAQGTPPVGPFKALRMAPYGGCALRPNGTIACWGLNNYGQATPPAGTFRAVDAGYFHACAVNAAGAAQCWGLDGDGQLAVPGAVYRDVAVGDYHSCGLTQEGQIVCWGRNDVGQATPPSSAGEFRALAVGRFHGCAIRDNGTLACWGANEAGQATPPTSGLYTAVSAGMSHSCAIRDDGARVCWGSTESGANPGLDILPKKPSGGFVGQSYAPVQFQLQAQNYVPGVAAFGVVDGTLPPGLTLAANGVLSGTPTAVGTYMFTVEAEDANGFIASQLLAMAILDPTPPVITPTVTGTLGDNGWYRSDVGIGWSVSDGQSAISATTGCNPSTLTTDSPGAGYTCTATSAGGTSSQTVTVKRDTVWPGVVTTAPTATFNDAGWSRAPVTVHYECSDDTSGVASCPADDTIATEGSAVETQVRHATDNAGNSGPSGILTLAIDLTAPDTTLDTTPPANSISADATFAFSATDALSGVDRLECSLDGATFAACASPLDLQGLADGSHTFKVRALDVAGNVDATPAQYTWTVDVDTTPPVITPSVSGTLGDNGWYVGDVTVSFNVSENDTYFTGMTGCNTVVVSTDTPGASFTCTASSPGGTASQSVTVKLDKTAPQVSAAPVTAANAAGWYRDDVVVAYTCSDALSGVVACPASQVLTGEGAAVASTPRMVTDAAGNTSAPASATVKIDRTAPVLAPSVAQPLLLNAVAAAQANASDALSGIDEQSCGALTTTSVGARSVACTATDIAGNTASASTGYRVSYGFAGFEAPLANALNGVRTKQYLPFKWRVFDADNADVSNLASFNVTRATVACPAGITPVAVTAYGTSNTTLQYLGGGRYQRNWLLSTGLVGSCVRIDVELGDGVKHAVMVKL